MTPSTFQEATCALYEFIHQHNVYTILRNYVIYNFKEMDSDDRPIWHEDDMPEFLMEIEVFWDEYPRTELAQSALLEYAENLAEEYWREKLDDARNFPIGWQGDEY